MSDAVRPRLGFVLEQTLGHVTHADNLRTILGADPDVDATFRDVAYDVQPWQERIPGWSNWTVRAGVRANAVFASLLREVAPDAVFVHTQVPAVLAQRWFGRVPTVVSVDATPMQYDELGDHYAHDVGPERLEAMKLDLNRACFARAARVVAWSEWAADGLVRDYDVPREKITVVPPGVHVDRWLHPGTPRPEGPVRVLFVGGDLARKGGDLLVAAVTRLRAELGPVLELDLVTKDDLPPTDGVRVHHGLRPNTPELKALYHDADVFCLPTLGDCLPMVLSEAGAAGLPLVSTRVGAIHEIVRDDETGLLVDVGDLEQLVDALRRLVTDEELRTRLGTRAIEVVTEQFDAVTNARRVVELLEDVADTPTAPAPSPVSGGALATTVATGLPAPGPLPVPTGGRVLLTVSGEVPEDLAAQVADGRRPRPDYTVMAARFGADLLDVTAARTALGALGPIVERVLGSAVLVALVAFRLRRRYRVVFTDGEHVGMPYAVLRQLFGRGGADHHMIGHLLTPPKKAVPWRVLGLHRGVDLTFVYASAQRQAAIEQLGIAPDAVVLVPFMVDSTFFRPSDTPRTGRPVVSSAGLELRDYPTMLAAVDGLDADVVVAAASPWSRRDDSTAGQHVPDNVEIRRLPLDELRDLYDRSDVLVMPLLETPFQAGVTTLLEGMAMALPVVCSATTGQTDVVVEGVTGTYVPPGDVAALRSAIEGLLADPERARALGEAGRRRVEEEMDVERYAELLGGYVDAAAKGPA